MKKSLIILSLMGLSATQVNASVQQTIEPAASSLLASVSNASITSTSFATSANNPNFSSGRLTSSAPPAVAAARAARAAHASTTGYCAKYVRRALQAAGYEFTSQRSAYQYATNGTLAQAGFVKLSNNNYQPQIGDVAVFNRTSRNPHGHIQIYDGSQWVSDFRQNKFSPYTTHNGYSVWRDGRYLDASNQGTYLAMND